MSGVVFLGVLVGSSVAVAAYTFGFWYRGRVEQFVSREPIRLPKDSASAADPLSKDGPASQFESGLREMIHQEVSFVLRGRIGTQFDGFADQLIAMELIARGWIAYKPAERLDRA